MKHNQLPKVTGSFAECKCGHKIQPSESRIKLKGFYSKCHTCFLKGELK